MAAIKKKNFLRLSDGSRTRVWNEIRTQPMINEKVTVADIFGGVIGSIIRFSVSARGVAVFLVGDDPLGTR